MDFPTFKRALRRLDPSLCLKLGYNVFDQRRIEGGAESSQFPKFWMIIRKSEETSEEYIVLQIQDDLGNPRPPSEKDLRDLQSVRERWDRHYHDPKRPSKRDLRKAARIEIHDKNDLLREKKRQEFIEQLTTDGWDSFRRLTGDRKTFGPGSFRR